MPPAIASLTTRLFDATARRARRAASACWSLLHLAALAILLATEGTLVSRAAFLLTWGLLNFGCLLLLRRPAVAAALSLALLAVLILLSQFKHDVLLMTVNFVDLMVIDADTFAFLMNIFPQLGAKVAIAVALGADRARC